ncbi:deoxynucleoside kinase [Agaribacterium haliotis]|uniref:deoxynucleoside kinase n=1 Tax=Agaribacterium haliotis TaxID=2013869 RepID=UPI000BB52C8C|nr:deoxynucleoside kinase [Agaribacterium haliotis]
MSDSQLQGLSAAELPRFIAIEGCIGVGKTSLAQRLAESFSADAILEKTSSNPFLDRFYKNERNSALPTQLFFLFQRTQQLNDLCSEDLFQKPKVADFLIDKDPLFAEVTLDDDELKLYRQIYQQTQIEAPRPDLVVYLQAPIDVLQARIEQRGVANEQLINNDYLSALNDAYARFFHFYEQSPLLIVNATEIDWINNEQDYQNLVNYLLTIRSGRHYYNPRPAMF